MAQPQKPPWGWMDESKEAWTPWYCCAQGTRGLSAGDLWGLQPGEAAVPKVFKRCSTAASHPERAKMEPGVALGRKQERKRARLSHLSPVPGPAELLSPAAQRASEARAPHTICPRLAYNIADRGAHPCQHGSGQERKSHVFCGKDDDFFFSRIAFPSFQLCHLAEVRARKNG